MCTKTIAPLGSFLAIAIPTFRRPALLRKSLESVIAAAAPYGCLISVFDDSVSGVNDEVLTWLQECYGNVSVVRNEKNLGIDENIARCMDETNAEYVWLLGEDDLLNVESVRCVLQMLRKGELPFVFVNYSYVSNDYTRILRRKRLEIVEDAILPGREFFERYIWAAGFIGGCIIRRSDWLKVERSKYSGTFFTHVGVIAEVIRESKVGLIASPVVWNRAENVESTSWRDSSFEVNFGWDKMLQALGHAYPVESILAANLASREIFWHRSIAFFVSKRADGLYRLPVWSKYVANGDFGRCKSLALLCLAFVPVLPLRYFKIAAKAVRGTFITVGK